MAMAMKTTRGVVKKKKKLDQKKKQQVKVKRKRGRPPKPESEKVKVEKVLKKRGRPKKEYPSKFKSYRSSFEPEDYVPPQSYKFLGYCPKVDCGSMVSSKDLDKKAQSMFICPVCQKRDRVSKLKNERDTDKPAPRSKKEFLSTQVTAVDIDADVDVDVDIDIDSSTECE